MKEKFIRCLVDRLWRNEVFQKEIASRVSNEPVRWVFERFGKCLTNTHGYTLIHEVEQAVPFIYNDQEEVIAAAKEFMPKEEPVVEKKPKRKYNKKKKEA